MNWCEETITDRDTFNRIYQKARTDQAVSLLVRLADQQVEMRMYFRMKQARWAESTYGMTPRPRKGTWGRTTPIGRRLVHSSSSDAHLSCSFLPRMATAPHVNFGIDTVPRKTDNDILHLQISYLTAEYFVLDFPSYQFNLPSKDGSTKQFVGELSAWSTVNLGLEEHNWIPPNSCCFAFAYPPECKKEDKEEFLDGADVAVSCFFRNGAYLYFNFGDGDADLYDTARNRDVTEETVVNCAVVFVPHTVKVCIVHGLQHPVKGSHVQGSTCDHCRTSVMCPCRIPSIPSYTVCMPCRVPSKLRARWMHYFAHGVCRYGVVCMQYSMPM